MFGTRKILYLVAGFALIALATLGIFLPLLPTTPLLLLAAWCFANSSEKCHQWLLNHKIFGGIIRNWQENRCMPLKAKMVSVTMIILFGGFAIYRLENIYIRVIGGLFCLIGLLSVLRIPICKKD